MTTATDGFGSLFTRTEQQLGIVDTFGTQAAWAVDEAAGDDSSVGTPAEPLASVGELVRRLSYTTIRQNTTVQLVGDVTAPLDLVNTTLTSGVTLTISGTATSVATGTISVVSGIGPGSAYPWTVDTTGLDWTAVTGRRLVTNTGKTFWVVEVVTANQVILSAGTVAAGTVSAPVVAETFTVHTLSTTPLPCMSILGGFVSAGSIFGLTIQDLRFTGGSTHPLFFATMRARLYGCQIDMPASGGLSLNGQNISLISTKIVGSGSGFHQVQSTGLASFTAVLFDTANFQYRTANRCSHTSVVYNNAKLDVRNSLDIQSGGVHIRNATGGDSFTVGAGAVVVAPTTTSFVSGANNTGGVGINVQSGASYLYQTSSKPTLSNATADTKIGGTNTAYASIPTVNATNTAKMVVIL